MKAYLYITDPESWLKNAPENRGHLLQLSESENMTEYGWHLIKIMKINVSEINDDEMRAAALKKIDIEEKKQVAENEVRMWRFEDRRQKLLAIEHQAEA